MLDLVGDHPHQAALAHLGERQTEVNFCPFLSRYKKYSGGTVFDPQKRQFCFAWWHAFCFQVSSPGQDDSS
jgi:hypothetical protein